MHCAADFTQRHRTAERQAAKSATNLLRMAAALLTSNALPRMLHVSSLSRAVVWHSHTL